MRILATLLAVVMLTVPALAGETVGLNDAAQKNLIQLENCTPKNLRTAHVTIKNLTDESISIEPLGSSITPGDRGRQRLGLAFAETDIVISANATWSGNIHSVCRDQDLRSPIGQTSYTFGGAVDSFERSVLTFWSEHRFLPQTDVNDVVWKDKTFEDLKQEAREVQEALDAIQPAEEESEAAVEEGAEASDSALGTIRSWFRRRE